MLTSDSGIEAHIKHLNDINYQSALLQFINWILLCFYFRMVNSMVDSPLVVSKIKCIHLDRFLDRKVTFYCSSFSQGQNPDSRDEKDTRRDTDVLPVIAEVCPTVVYFNTSLIFRSFSSLELEPNICIFRSLLPTNLQPTLCNCTIIVLSSH